MKQGSEPFNSRRGAAGLLLVVGVAVLAFVAFSTLSTLREFMGGPGSPNSGDETPPVPAAAVSIQVSEPASIQEDSPGDVGELRARVRRLETRLIRSLRSGDTGAVTQGLRGELASARSDLAQALQSPR